MNESLPVDNAEPSSVDDVEVESSQGNLAVVANPESDELMDGQTANTVTRSVLYESILPTKEFPRPKEKADGPPVRATVTGPDSLEIRKTKLELSKHEVFVLNVLLMRRNSPPTRDEICSYGFYPEATAEGVRRSVLSKTISSLSRKLNLACGDAFLLAVGNRDPVHYVSPRFRLNEGRRTVETILTDSEVSEPESTELLAESAEIPSPTDASIATQPARAARSTRRSVVAVGHSQVAYRRLASQADDYWRPLGTGAGAQGRVASVRADALADPFYDGVRAYVLEGADFPVEGMTKRSFRLALQSLAGPELAESPAALQRYMVVNREYAKLPLLEGFGRD